MVVLIRQKGPLGVRTCSALCHKSDPKKPCNCICEGANHGIGREAAHEKYLKDQNIDAPDRVHPLHHDKTTPLGR